MPEDRTCSECGQPLPGGASEALCPICALRSVADHDLKREPPAAGELRHGVGARAFGLPNQDPACPAATRPSPLPRSLGDYELIEEIARGGMGVVFRARQKSLNRIVALKMVIGGPLASVAAIQRFQAEAQAAASLQHSNIVAIHEVGEQEGQAFFSMDYVEGRNLAELLRDGPLAPRRAAGYVKTIAQAIEYAHQRGILHRDLKPSNVLIDQFDQPRITDFGLAKRLSDSQLSTLDAPVTLSGQVLGSPNFMAPEQAQGRHRDVGPPSDVYSLGALLYDLITGRPPFQAATLTEVLRQVAMTEPAAPRLLNPSIPRDLETICLKCLEKEPRKRYRTAQMLAEELGRFLEGQPILARPIGPAGKAWRWCRRNPRLSVAPGAVLLSVLVGLAGVTWQWRRAEAEGLLARRHAYAADMKEVQRALEENDLGRARALLDRHRPPGKVESRKQKAEIDLRGWEWRYLWARCQSEERFTLHQYSNEVSALAFSSDGKWLAVRRGNQGVALWDAVATRPKGELAAHGWGWCKGLAFSPRGNLLAWAHQEANGSSVVNLRDVSTQQDMAPLPHSKPIASVAFSPDAKAVATLTYDGTVLIWDLEAQHVMTQFVTAPVDVGSDRFTGKAKVRSTSVADGTGGRRALESQPVPTKFITAEFLTAHYGCVLFSPDGQWLAVGEARPQIRLLERATGKETVIPVPAPADGISALAFSLDSRWLAAGCGAGTNDIPVWDLATGRPAVWLAGHGGWVAALAFSPDGHTLASASSDQTVRLWDLTGHAAPRQLQGNLDEVWALAWSPDGKDLVTGARDGSVRVWDPAAKPAVPYEPLPESVQFWGLTFLPDSQTFLTTTRPEGAVVRWDTVGLHPVERLSFLGTNHTGVDLSPDGRWLALGDDAGNVQMWDFPGRRMVTNLVSHGTNIIALWFSPHGNFLACGVPESGLIWAVAGWTEVSLPPLKEKIVFDGNFSPDERTAALGYVDGTAAWWDLATRQRTEFFDCRYASYVHAVFSPDGRHFATGGLNGLMTLWEVATRQARPIGRGHRNALHDLLFSPDSRRLLASGTSPKDVVKFWDVETVRDVATLPGVPGWYCHIGFSPHGKTLFAISMEGTVLFWRAPSFEEIAQRESQQRSLKPSKEP